MLDVRHGAATGRAQYRAVERHVAPARHAESATGANRFGQHLGAMRAAGVVRVQEEDAHRHARGIDA